MALVPFRLWIGLLGLYACALVYCQRVALSITILAMTRPIGPESSQCNQSNPFNRSKIDSCQPEFQWNAKLQGIILASNFFLYIFIFSFTFVGPVTSLIGAKWVAFLGALGPCLLSFATPLVTRSFGAPGLITIRIAMGGFQGCVYGPLFSLYTKWFPNPRERTTANNGLLIGSAFGCALMFALAGWISQTAWPSVYYLNGALYLPWLVLWLYYAADDPEECRHLDDDELQYIRTSATSVVKTRRPASLFTVLTSLPVLCSITTRMCIGVFYFLFITKLPDYLATVHSLPLPLNGLFNAMASLSHGLLLTVSRPLAQRLIHKSFTHRHLPSSLVIRKVFQCLAMLGPAVCLALIPMAGCHTAVVLTLLFVAMLLSGAASGSELIPHYAPNSAATVFGFSSTLAFVMGMAVPYLMGILLDDSANHADTWNGVFYGTAAVQSAGALVFVLFATDKQQAWDRVEDVDETSADFKSIKQESDGILK